MKRLVFLLIVLTAVGRAEAGIITHLRQWSSLDGGNDHYYALVLPTDASSNFTWQEADSVARSSFHLGSLGHLVVITTAAENQFLTESFGAHLIGTRNTDGSFADRTFAWIGLSDGRVEGLFEWVTGESFTYSNWDGGEPNNLLNENYVFTWQYDNNNTPPLIWNDSFDSGFNPSRWKHGYFVEFDGPFAQPVPEP